MTFRHQATPNIRPVGDGRKSYEGPREASHGGVWAAGPPEKKVIRTPCRTKRTRGVYRVASTNRSSLVLRRLINARLAGNTGTTKKKSQRVSCGPTLPFFLPWEKPFLPKHGSSTNHAGNKVKPVFFCHRKKNFQLLYASQSGAEPWLRLDGAVIFSKLLQTPGSIS